jgi:hypothetical protein
MIVRALPLRPGDRVRICATGDEGVVRYDMGAVLHPPISVSGYAQRFERDELELVTAG